MKKEISAVRRKKNLVAVGLAMGIFAVASGASASVLLPGQSKSTTGSVPFSGTPATPVLTENFTGTDVFDDVVFSGTITSQVYVDSGTGDLDFVYQFSNNNTSPDGILRLSVAGFAGFSVNADYVPATGAAFPTTVNLDNTGDILGYSFSDSAPVAPGDTTDELFVKTDATQYTVGNAGLQDGGNGDAGVYVPVPEPASLAIVAIGLTGLCSRRRTTHRQ